MSNTLEINLSPNPSHKRPSLKRFKANEASEYPDEEGQARESIGNDEPDSVLSCLQSVRLDKESRVKAIYR